MESNEFKVEGLSEVLDAIDALPVEIQRKVIGSILGKAGRKYIVNELKSTLNYSNESEKSIKSKSLRNGKIGIKAGVMGGAGYKIRWADLGTSERKTKKGYNRGKITGRNQVSTTIDRQIEPILDYIEEEFGTEVNRILERRLKKLNSTTK